MLYREAGQFKTSYAADMAIFPIRQDRIALALLLAFAFVGVPLLAAYHVWPLGSDYLLRAILIPFLILALKALPVLIIGGFTSVPGAIVGGLIVGAGEKLAEAYLGPYIGGGIEYWFAYVLALVVLLARPQGLFGERIIERI